jgi:hypothetical protein
MTMSLGLVLAAALLSVPEDELLSVEARVHEAEQRMREDEQRTRQEERKVREEEQKVREEEQKTREEERYERGTEALDEGEWEEAISAFDDVIEGKGRKADGALYWKAYATSKRGQREEALRLVDELRRAYPESRWLKEAKALEAEIRRQSGQAPRPEAEADEDLKVMAINSLLNTDPERALPMLEKLVAESKSRKLQDRALFVLSQSSSPRAREIVVKIAQGVSNPDLQRKAIRYLGIFGGRENRQMLAQIYAGSTDRAVKKAVLQAYLVSGDKERVLEIVRTEKDPGLRREGIRTLGIMGGQAEVWTMYQAETDRETREAALEAIAIGGGMDKLLQIAKGDKDPEMRREAIQKLGVFGGARMGETLVEIYKNEGDRRMREAALQGLFIQGNAKALVEVARTEKDPDLKKKAVSHLSHMNSKEGTDFLLEILNK